jgi:hypothetical protein
MVTVFFVSLATVIHQQLQDESSLGDKAKEHLQILGLPVSGVKGTACKLRELLVNEWISHPEDYKPYLLSGQDYMKEALNFLQDGHFISDLGNCMPLAAANVLRIPIVIFTEMVNFPSLPICPRDEFLSETLAFEMTGAGHYDIIQPIADKHQIEETRNMKEATCTNQTSFRCGQGAKRKKKESVSCHEYKSGCKCFQSVVGCNTNCQCINCQNPRGRKASDSDAQLTCASRKRKAHEFSTATLGGKDFTEMKAGGTLAVHWTVFEELLLLELTLTLSSKSNLDANLLFKVYNDVVNITASTTSKHYLGKKSETQVARKLSSLLHNDMVFQKLLTEQLMINMSK